MLATIFFSLRKCITVDAIGDTLRGTKGIMLDMYRQPDKLLEALEAITPILIKMGISYTTASGNPMVLIPIHKGADGFLSDEQFKNFYWSSFRKLLVGLVEEGRVPCVFACHFPFPGLGYITQKESICAWQPI